MAARIGLCTAMLAATALAACSGGGGGGSSSDGPTSGLANPGSITGASADYINSLNNELAIVSTDLVGAGRTDLPLSGTATYSGFGSIFDSSLTTADNTAARLRGRSVVTDVSGVADLNARTITITQSNFRDVDGAAVSGSATWTTERYEAPGFFYSRVTGNVGGTTFDSGSEQARVGFYADGNNTALLGAFSEAPVGTSGALRGSSLSGDFAATGTITP